MDKVQVGNVYRLNAPWDPRHSRFVLVVHSRIGVSEEYQGMPIYHIVNSDNFNTEPDWDTEYVESNFSDADIDISTFLRNEYVEMLSNIKDPRRGQVLINQSTNQWTSYLDIYLYSVKGTPGDFGYLVTQQTLIGDGALLDKIYNFQKPGILTKQQILGLSKYYNNGTFIELEPPN